MRSPRSLSVADQDHSEFNVVFIPAALDDSGLTPAQFRVYCHLARRAGKKVAFPGIRSMAIVCGLNKSTVISAVRALEQRGMITVELKVGIVTRYRITAVSKWSKTGNGGVRKEGTVCTEIGNGGVPFKGTKGTPIKDLQGRGAPTPFPLPKPMPIPEGGIWQSKASALIDIARKQQQQIWSLAEQSKQLVPGGSGKGWRLPNEAQDAWEQWERRIKDINAATIP